MMEKLSVTLVQTSLVWENPEANLAHFGALIADQKNKTDLIVLPEMFTTGFTMKPEKFAEKHEGAGLAWMKQKASLNNCCMTGSICTEDKDKFYNRLYWVEKSGDHQYYNKRHLFRMGEENDHYTAGTKKIITEIKGWKILPLVCYDLRFPVWSRNKWKKAGSQQSAVGSEQHGKVGSRQVADGSKQPAGGSELQADYDVLIYVANWPEVRNYVWKQLLIARAIENQCYVIGVNRIGADGSIMMHAGDSVVIDPLGKMISKTQAHKENVETVELDYAYLQELRKKFPVGLDADSFTLTL